MTENTKSHKYKFRAGSAGIAHVWIVEFGKILDLKLKSPDILSAFQSLNGVFEINDEDSILILDLIEYIFKNYRTYLKVDVTYKSSGKTIFKKIYTVYGKAQTGKVFWGGAFAMKNAIQQSTNIAIDEFLANMINDLNKQFNINP